MRKKFTTIKRKEKQKLKGVRKKIFKKIYMKERKKVT